MANYFKELGPMRPVIRDGAVIGGEIVPVDEMTPEQRREWVRSLVVPRAGEYERRKRRAARILRVELAKGRER